MSNTQKLSVLLGVLAVVLLAAYLDNKYLHLMVPLAFAHCDTMGGPVIKDAQQALENGKIDLVLKWIKPADEAVIRKAFEQAREVRKARTQGKEMADMYFSSRRWCGSTGPVRASPTPAYCRPGPRSSRDRGRGQGSGDRPWRGPGQGRFRTHRHDHSGAVRSVVEKKST